MRLFERVPYPWTLNNYLTVRKGALNASYFAVSYVDHNADSQVLAIYELPRYRNSHISEVSDGVPVTRVLGGWWIPDTS